MNEPIHFLNGQEFFYLDVKDLLPIIIICGISILSVTIWLLIVWRYTQRQRHANT
jgi:hypothetical protein